MNNAHPCNPLRAGIPAKRSPRLVAGAAGKAELSPAPSQATPSPLPQLLGKRGMKTSEQRLAAASEVPRSSQQSTLPRFPPRQNKKMPEIRRFFSSSFSTTPPCKASALELCMSQDPSSQSSRLSLSHPSCHPEFGKWDSGNESQGARPAPGKAQPPPPQAGLAAWVFLHVIARCM